MKRVVVRVSDNYNLDQAASAILKLYGYLSFVESFRTFSIITFDCPERYENVILNQLRALNVVKRATWDGDKFSCNPVYESELTHSTSGSVTLNSVGETTTTANTRNLTGSGTGTIYVKVQNIGGADFFVFSQTQGGSYSRFANQTGFLQGATYTFDQSDSSNATHQLVFSETPDGTHTTGGSAYTTGVTTTGTPGQAGAQVEISMSASTPSILYYYCSMHSGMGRYQVTPNRYGTINLHDYWHLDRLTKQDRQYLNRQFSYTQDGDGADIYVIDTGVRGASRPTGNNAALHSELYNPDYVADLNGTTEQQNYRVFQLANYAGAHGTNNEDDNGHGTYCAILSAGRLAGVARKAKVYALKAFNSSLSASYTDILGAYQAVIDHNDSGNANYKGNNRPAIINASFGPTIPTQNYPYIELNDAGDDTGTDEEILDDIEGTIASQKNLIIVRSAGNGFKNSSDNFAGPIQGKCIAGTRTAGYPDNTNGGINNVETNQNKVSVGATEYNDRWADFSNYGAGVTTTAPGARILVPQYDWLANTPQTSATNYTTIGGTSFSAPLVTGIAAAWCGANGYTLTTNNLPGTFKTYMRTPDATGDIRKGGSTYYPTNSIEDRKLIDNPYETNNGSDFLIVKFNPADASHFLGNVGKKVQLRTTGSTAGSGSSTPTTYNITVTAPNSSYYTLNGTDRNGSVSGNNASITVNVGDTINLNLSNVSSIHPTYFRDSSNGPNVSTPAATGQGGTGNSVVSWTPNQVGSYIYQCSAHLGMMGTITVNSASGGAGSVVVGGINVSALSQSGWLNIAAESAVNNTITVQNSSNATASTTGGGSNNYLALIKSEAITHESIDGVVSTSTSLRSQTDTQEAGGSGQYSNVAYYPVDSGVDFDYSGTGSTLTNKRGAFFPYIDTSVTWTTSTGALNGSPYADGASVSVQLGLSGQTFANEPTFETYTISGDAIGASGLTFNTATGELSGTVTSDYLDTTFNFTVTENVTGNARAYSFTTTGTGVLITVTGNPVSTSIEAGANVNATFGPVAATSSDGSTILYQWEFSSNGGVGWSNVVNGGFYSGATSATLQVDDEYSLNAYQYRCKMETSTSIAPGTTTAATLTVFRVITIDTQPTNAQPMAPAAAAFTTAASTKDGAAITYQWQSSQNGDGVTYADISGANSTTYTTGSTSYDNDYGDYYRCKVNATGAAEVLTNAGRNLVQRSINITSQPANVTGAVGGTVSFGVAANTSDNDAGDITYQWEVSITSGASWSNVSEGTGGTTATYTTPTLTTAYDSYQYRCLLSANGATTIPSNSATLQVETVTVVVSNQPSSASVNEGATATFTTLGGVTMAPVGGNAASSSFEVDQFDTPSSGGGNAEGQSQHEPSVTYQWEKTDDGNRNIAVTVGADTVGGQATGVFYFDGVEKPASYSVKKGSTYIFDQSAASNANYNNQHHPLMFSTSLDGELAGGNHYMMGVTYKLDGSTVTMAGYVSGFTSATTRTIEWTVPINEQNATLYYWCHFHTGQGNSIAVSDQTWTTLGGATSASYTTAATTYADDHQDKYRCKIDAVGASVSAYTNAVDLTVLRTFSITSQPANVTANEGATASFTVAASGSSGTPTYQWERSDDGGNNYTTVAGATSASYTTPTLTFAADNNDRYRSVVSLVGSAAPITSTFGLLTILRVISIQTQPQNQGVIEGNTATFNIVASITSDVITYQWQKSTDGGANWSNINGANAGSYTTPATVYPTTPSEQYRCILSNPNATTVTSNAATLTVNESEFVSAPSSVTPVIDTDTSKTFSRQPVINTSAFVVEYSGSVHFSSFWRIRRVSDNVTVYSTADTFASGDTGNLTSFTVPSGTLDFDTAYAVQVKFRDNAGLESAFSSAVNFTTPLVDQPAIQTITPAFNPTINVDPIAMKSGYSHSSSDWQFSPVNTFSTIVHQSLGNSTNLLSYTLPGAVNLSANTTYYVRIRFNINPT
jgi:plastocyanin